MIFMSEKRQIQKFRQRGYLPSDASREIVIVYENDPIPLNPDGSNMRKIWDNSVENHIIIIPHVHQDGDVD